MQIVSEEELKSIVLCDSEYKNFKYGPSDSLEVIGTFRRLKRNQRFHLVRCSTCSVDEELFGLGIFVVDDYGIRNRRIPCGCSNAPQWTIEQNLLRCRRACEKRGLRLNSFSEKWVGVRDSVCFVECPEHGVFENKVYAMIKGTGNCYECRNNRLSKSLTDQESVAIEKIKSRWSYPQGTEIYPVQRDLITRGPTRWKIICSVCNIECEATAGDIKRGTISCYCKVPLYQYAYINIIEDTGNLPIALKFGITINPHNRRINMACKTAYEVRCYGVWKFEKVEDCKMAEKECKNKLVCGILNKYEFPDGYTETTSIVNLENIVEIYESFGGILTEDYDENEGLDSSLGLYNEI